MSTKAAKLAAEVALHTNSCITGSAPEANSTGLCCCLSVSLLDLQSLAHKASALQLAALHTRSTGCVSLESCCTDIAYHLVLRQFDQQLDRMIEHAQHACDDSTTQ